jgi:hypothetical protein
MEFFIDNPQIACKKSLQVKMQVKMVLILIAHRPITQQVFHLTVICWAKCQFTFRFVYELSKHKYEC